MVENSPLHKVYMNIAPGKNFTISTVKKLIIKLYTKKN
jgi:hypothetical protein